MIIRKFVFAISSNIRKIPGEIVRVDVAEEQPKRIDCVLVAAGKYHDIDFARLKLANF